MAKSGHTAHEQTLGGMLGSAEAFLKDLRFPNGAFEPAGDWRQTYLIWLIGRNSCIGTIQLARTRIGDETFRLDVDWAVLQNAKSMHRIRASITCLCDRLATPIGWTMQTRLHSPDGAAIEGASGDEEAACRKGVTTIAGRKAKAGQKALGPWTSNFCLLELVQRLGNGPVDPLEFTLLDFLTTRKDGHSLAYHGRQEALLGGRKVPLIGYCHLGNGVLPEVYWLDEHQRLRIVVSGLRAYVAGEKEVPA